ncbi:hypothetical protein NDU88_001897 [Pleurodeles waltl]|uniref:Uncharacterized protein n=1 Tax=Pleurodeles waltl TaxID=8319 RepID=A0AAV7SC57_PLEWA|nr:hypothetical protein NDU88_001897 [Pleurodeles waltl]
MSCTAQNIMPHHAGTHSCCLFPMAPRQEQRADTVQACPGLWGQQQSTLPSGSLRYKNLEHRGNDTSSKWLSRSARCPATLRAAQYKPPVQRTAMTPDAGVSETKRAPRMPV